jgi:hypothetical protein
MNALRDLHGAAEWLGVKPRKLQEWLRKHPCDVYGEPFYGRMGRTKTFDENDLVRIRAATKEEERCRLNSSRRGKAKARTGRSGGRISKSEWTEAAELTGDPSLSKFCDSSKGGSSVVNFPKQHQSRTHRHS